MNIRKFQPASDLSAYVSHFLLIDHEGFQPVVNNLIPDTHIVLSFRYRGNIFQSPDHRPSLLPATVISGLRKSSRHLQYEPGTSNLLVIFKEGGIHAFTNTPAHHLFGDTIDSAELWAQSGIRHLPEHLAEASGDNERIAFVESFLRSIRRPLSADAAIVNGAIRSIGEQEGNVRIHDLAASMYISLDVFEKKFRAAVGASPRQYASIVRLRSLIRRFPSQPSLTAAAYQAGYFDQPHFIRDFKQFTGQAPGAFFRATRFW